MSLHLQKILKRICVFIQRCWGFASLKKQSILMIPEHIIFISATKTVSQARSSRSFLSRERRGTVGKGQAGRIYFSVPKGSFFFWKTRLEKNGLQVTEQTLLSEQILLFHDTEGLPLAIMEDAQSKKSEWTAEGITKNEAILGIKGALLYSYAPEATIQFLIEKFGYNKIQEEDQIVRLKSSADIGDIIDVHLRPEKEDQAVMAPFITWHFEQQVRNRRSGRTCFWLNAFHPLKSLTENISPLFIFGNEEAFYLKWRQMIRDL